MNSCSGRLIRTDNCFYYARPRDKIPVTWRNINVKTRGKNISCQKREYRYIGSYSLVERTNQIVENSLRYPEWVYYNRT